MNIRLLSIDIDGTLLDPTGRISSENKDWICKGTERGIITVLGTGRALATSLPYYDEVNLTTAIVTLNGGEIWGDRNTLLRRSPLEANRVSLVLDMAFDHAAQALLFTSDGVFDGTQWVGQHRPGVCIKILLVHDDPRQIAALDKALRVHDDLQLSQSGPRNLEINGRNVSKLTGVEFLCRRYGVSLDETAAIGDNTNDLQLIESCGYGIAMGNALDVVKDAARFVTKRNDENGVAHAIRHLLESMR